MPKHGIKKLGNNTFKEMNRYKTIVIAGGTGLIGQYLTSALIRKGYRVVVLTRSNKTTTNKIDYSYWNIEKREIDKTILLKADYIIHLTGAGIADKPWSIKRKKEILDSRVAPIKLIHTILKNNTHQLKAFISASGVGYYGAKTTNTLFKETAPSSNDFLGKTCLQWEQAVDKLADLQIRTVKIRTGIVLAKNGGVLPKMMLPFKFGLGAALGTGKQIMPWIHIDDLARIYCSAIENDSLNGAYNAIAGNVRNNYFSKILSKRLNKPFWLPNIPIFFLKLILGEMAIILTEGSRIDNKKVKAIPFQFEYETLKEAINSLTR